MAELFPEDPKLKTFAARFESDKFDPISAPIIISRTAQMRPKQMIPVVETSAPSRQSPMAMARQEQSPRPQYIRATASPKRPLGGLDEDDLNPAKRFQRGPSPLKGAAGRRLDQQRRNQASALHRDITFVLGILPPAHTYDGPRLNTNGLVAMLRDTPLPEFNAWKAHTGGKYLSQPAPSSHGRQPSGDFGQRGGSPFGRVASGGTYRNSPLRTEGFPGQSFGGDAAAGLANIWPGAAAYGAPPPGQYGGYR